MYMYMYIYIYIYMYIYIHINVGIQHPYLGLKAPFYSHYISATHAENPATSAVRHGISNWGDQGAEGLELQRGNGFELLDLNIC